MRAGYLPREGTIPARVIAHQDGHSYVFSLPEPTTASEPGDALQIASYSDGDVSVAGGVPCEDGAVMYSRSQIEQLVRHVTAPHIVLGAPAAP